MQIISLPAPIPIHHSPGDAIVYSSSQECLERSRGLLARTNDMVDPKLSGRPIRRPAAPPTADEWRSLPTTERRRAGAKLTI
jgi:hypothetical protein